MGVMSKDVCERVPKGQPAEGQRGRRLSIDKHKRRITTALRKPRIDGFDSAVDQ